MSKLTVIFYLPYTLLLLVLIPLWYWLQKYIQRKVFRAFLFAFLFTPIPIGNGYSIFVLPFPFSVISIFTSMIFFPSFLINFMLLWGAMEFNKSLLIRSIAYAIMFAPAIMPDYHGGRWYGHGYFAPLFWPIISSLIGGDSVRLSFIIVPFVIFWILTLSALYLFDWKIKYFIQQKVSNAWNAMFGDLKKLQ